MSGGIDLNHARGPDGLRLYAIGDVHGCLGLLEAMHAKIEGDIEKAKPADWRIIHLGDYVDRGPDSKGVLDRLVARQKADPRFVTLAGNHDTAFIDFLQQPTRRGLFANYGGVDTARSYGIDMQFGDEAAFLREHERLVDAVPPEHVELLLTLSFSTSFGDFFFCHAGIRPGVSLERQSPDDLLWIRGEFLGSPVLHPKVIVHGHTPVPAPELRPNRIGIDTGAFQTGVLSAVMIDGGTTKLIRVRG